MTKNTTRIETCTGLGQGGNDNIRIKVDGLTLKQQLEVQSAMYSQQQRRSWCQRLVLGGACAGVLFIGNLSSYNKASATPTSTAPSVSIASQNLRPSRSSAQVTLPRRGRSASPSSNSAQATVDRRGRSASPKPPLYPTRGRSPASFTSRRRRYGSSPRFCRSLSEGDLSSMQSGDGADLNEAKPSDLRNSVSQNDDLSPSQSIKNSESTKPEDLHVASKKEQDIFQFFQDESELLIPTAIPAQQYYHDQAEYGRQKSVGPSEQHGQRAQELMIRPERDSSCAQEIASESETTAHPTPKVVPSLANEVRQPIEENLFSSREGVNPHPPGTFEHALYNHQIWAKHFYGPAQNNRIRLENELLVNTSLSMEMGVPNLLQYGSHTKSMTDQLKDQLEIADLELSIREREANIPKIFQDIEFARAAEIRAQAAEQRDQKEKEASVSKIKQEMELVRAEEDRKNRSFEAEEDRKKAEEDRKNRLFEEQLKGETLKNQILEKQLEELKKNKKD